MTKIEDSLDDAEKSIRRYFQAANKRVFVNNELYAIFAAERDKWGIVKWAGPTPFISFLTEKEILREIRLESEHYAPKGRLISSNATAYEVALSLAKGGYFSHGTAIALHRLNDQIPKTLYINREQSVKKVTKGTLTQERLDQAFSRSQRASKYVFRYEAHRIVLLSGKNTARQGVVQLPGPSGELIRTTNIARTLVDIAVRPGYAGGIIQVLEAYRGALGKVTGKEILSVLKKLDFVYPYQQSIGFLLERAKYSDADIRPFRALRTGMDFYLVHGMRDRSYDSNWKLFYPKGL